MDEILRSLKIKFILEEPYSLVEQEIIDNWNNIIKNIIIQKEDNGDIFFYDINYKHVIMGNGKEFGNEYFYIKYHNVWAFFEKSYLTYDESKKLIQFLLFDSFKLKINKISCIGEYYPINKPVTIWENFKLKS